MKSEDVRSTRDLGTAVRFLLDKSEADDIRMAELEAFASEIHKKQGYLSVRKPIAVPRFPHILTKFGIFPPEARGELNEP